MSAVDPHEHYEELAVGHAFAALEPEDEQVFLAHLSGCARCEQAVAEHHQTLAELASTSDAGDPPPELLDRILAEVEQDSAPARHPHAGAPVVGSQREGGSQSSSGSQPVRLADFRARRQSSGGDSRLRRAGALSGIAAGLALIVSLSVWNSVLQRDRDESRGLSERLAQAVRTLEDDGARSVPLKTPSGSVAAVAVVRGDQMSLLVDGLPANDAERTTYVLWEKGRYGDVRPVAAFDVRGEQMDVVNGLRLPSGGLTGVEALAVTREKGNTPPPMTTEPMLAFGTTA